MKVIDQIHVDDSKLECGHFNRCEHTRLELEPGVMQTISVKLPNGQFVTFSFVPGSNANEFECCDIHTTARLARELELLRAQVNGSNGHAAPSAPSAPADIINHIRR